MRRELPGPGSSYSQCPGDAVRPMGANVLRIDVRRRDAQILDSVIGPDSIDVIDGASWKLPVVVDPREFVGCHLLAANPNSDVPIMKAANVSMPRLPSSTEIASR